MNFLKKHSEALPVSLALVLLAILLVSFVWGVSYVIGAVNNSVNLGAAGSNQTSEFNLSGAAALNLHGLAPGGTPAPASAPVPTVPAATTTTLPASAAASSSASSSPSSASAK